VKKTKLWQVMTKLNIEKTSEGRRAVVLSPGIEQLDQYFGYGNAATTKPMNSVLKPVPNRPDLANGLISKFDQLVKSDPQPALSVEGFAQVMADLLELRSPQNILGPQEDLERAAANGWIVSNKQLKAILRCSSVPSGQAFDRFGFRLTKVSEPGRRAYWRIEKL
jgi:hypothetical protein